MVRRLVRLLRTKEILRNLSFSLSLKGISYIETDPHFSTHGEETLLGVGKWLTIPTNGADLTLTDKIENQRSEIIYSRHMYGMHLPTWLLGKSRFIVRRAGLLWSQQDFEWRWSVPLFKCLTVLEFSFILFDLCLLITFFNFIMNYVPIVTFWIFTYHKIWILSIMFCSIWSYWIIYFLACLEVSWRVVS